MPTLEEYAARLRVEANKLRGVMFLQNGRNPSQGLDCLGLIVYLNRTCGISEFPDVDRTYPSDWYLHEQEELYLKGLAQHGTPIPVSGLRPGDIVTFALGRVFAGAGSLRIQHAGVILDGPAREFVHCIGGRGVLFSKLAERAWAKSFAVASRLTVVRQFLGELNG